MLLDFDKHRLHRKALSVAFKTEPDEILSRKPQRRHRLGRQPAGRTRRPRCASIPRSSRLTLDLAAVSFFGREIGTDVQAIKRAFIDMIAAAVSVVRVPIPGTPMARGVEGRKFMIDYFGRQIASRRVSDGEDMFTELCKRPPTTARS